jgi:hypothetical protein
MDEFKSDNILPIIENQEKIQDLLKKLNVDNSIKIISESSSLMDLALSVIDTKLIKKD